MRGKEGHVGAGGGEERAQGAGPAEGLPDRMGRGHGQPHRGRTLAKTWSPG